MKYKRVVVLCDKRTGSTFLCDALNSHPHILGTGELFMIRSRAKNDRDGNKLYKTYKKENNKANINKYISSITPNNQILSFKLIYGQCDHWRLYSFLQKKDTFVVHLIRKDPLARAISKFTKKSSESVVSPPPQDIVIDIKKNLERVKKFKKMIRKKKGRMEIIYENLIGKKEGKRENVGKLGAFNITSNQKTFLNEDINTEFCKKLRIDNIPMFSYVTKKNKGSKWDYLNCDMNKLTKLLEQEGLEKYLK